MTEDVVEAKIGEGGYWRAYVNGYRQLGWYETADAAQAAADLPAETLAALFYERGHVGKVIRPITLSDARQYAAAPANTTESWHGEGVE